MPIARRIRKATSKKAPAVARKAAAKAKPAKSSRKTAGRATKGTNGSYDPLAPRRVREILRRLDERCPNVTCALKHTSAWELSAAIILSAHCTDATVNRVTPELFRKYPAAAAFAALEPE